jgi:hypothetical protein
MTEIEESQNNEATKHFIDRELIAIGWPPLDFEQPSGILSCIFSLLKQRTVHSLLDLISARLKLPERFNNPH